MLRDVLRDKYFSLSLPSLSPFSPLFPLSLPSLLSLSLYSLPPFVVSDVQSNVILTPRPLLVNCNFFSMFFQDFLIVFRFLKYNYDMPGCKVVGIYPGWCFVSILDLWFMSLINFGKLSVTTTSIILISSGISVS